MLGVKPMTLQLPTLTDMFLIPPNHESLTCLIGISETFQILQIHAMHPPEPSLTIHSVTQLPESSRETAMILPVDPMVWVSNGADTLLTISKEGDLDFWTRDQSEGWRKTGRVRTGRENITKARCSSTKKSVLGAFVHKMGSTSFSDLCFSVVRKPEGDEVSIWDSKESQFSSGLEYSEIYRSAEWRSTLPNMTANLVG